MSGFFVFVWWLALSFIAGIIAGKKGRSAVGFFFLSVFLSPLIGILAAAGARRNDRAIDEAKIESGEFKKCPYCAESVRHEAVKCKHCGSDIPPPTLPAASSASEVGANWRDSVV